MASGSLCMPASVGEAGLLNKLQSKLAGTDQGQGDGQLQIKRCMPYNRYTGIFYMYGFLSACKCLAMCVKSTDRLAACD